MLICKKCLCEINGEVCPICGKKKGFREAVEGDEIFLTTADFVFYQVVEDILDDAGISYVKKGSLGAAVTAYVGGNSESYNYYVLLKNYNRSKKLLSKLPTEFSEEELNEYIDSYEGDGEE